MMKKTTCLRIINPLLLLLMISQTITGMFADDLHLGREGFEIIHGTGGLVLVLLMVLHLVCNWSWVRTQYGRKRSSTSPAAPETSSH